MTTKLGLAFSHGVLDCRVPGMITGCFWFSGKDYPITFEVSGRASRDLAGSCVFIRNPYPAPLLGPYLTANHAGTRGYVTCSARVSWKLPQPGMKVTSQLVNTAQFYWFSEKDGPVEIEFPNPEVEYTVFSPSEEVSVGEDGLVMPDECFEYLRELGVDDADAEAEDEAQEDEPGAVEDEGGERSRKEVQHLDEFAWEALIKDADRAAEKYSRLMEKYEETPDRDRLIAQEMGWVWFEKAADETVENYENTLPSSEDVLESVPVKEKEGIDWVRTADGDIVHPLYRRAFDLSLLLWKRCGIGGQVSLQDSPAAQELMRHCQGFVGKLAGALNGLAYDPRPQAGFVLAYLKRALQAFNQTYSALDAAEKESVVPVAYLDEFRQGLMEIRIEITNMMSSLRAQSKFE